jgi:glycosyltransferase involved in cell wall biosynthesis
MHILLANRWYPPVSNGGIAVYDYNLAHALVKLGHQVTIVAARWSAETPAFTDDKGVQVHRILAKQFDRLHRVPFLGRYMRPLLQIQYSVQVLRKLNQLENQPDVIEFAEVNGEGWAYLRQQQRKPVVVRCHTPTFVLREYHDSAEMHYDTDLTTRLEKSCIRRADGLTAPSRNMAETIAQHINEVSPDDFRVIPNALNTEQFAVCGRDYERQPVTVLHVGRLDRAKGIETLAHAIPQVVQQYPDVRFVYLGGDRPDGTGSTWQKRLSAYFAANQVVKNVTFTGSVEHDELLAWYARADIAVVPSMLYESFSYTVAQAMAAGLPVVATRIGGIPETVSDGQFGLLVDVGDVKAVADQLCMLIGKPDKRRMLGVAAAQYAQNQFSAEVVAEQALSLYQTII